MRNALDAIASGVAAIVISRNDRSTARNVLNLAAEARIPVTIADIGTTEGDCVSMSLGARRAVQAARKTDDILVAAFDGTPEVLEFIQSGKIVASGVQQPFQLGLIAAENVLKSIAGETVEMEVQSPNLVTTTDNAFDMTNDTKLNLFGIVD